MAGIYPNLATAVRTISKAEGVAGFYAGWGPNLAQKIPSYGLTWVFFQQFKEAHKRFVQRPPTDLENFGLGAAAAGATVCIMMPMDFAKTRIVTQCGESELWTAHCYVARRRNNWDRSSTLLTSSVATAGVVPYKGVIDCLRRSAKEEGVGALYKALVPRLASVVPMIGIQCKRIMRQYRDVHE
eukprot:7328-Heterococcus_DN1.PRE.1